MYTIYTLYNITFRHSIAQSHTCKKNIALTQYKISFRKILTRIYEFQSILTPLLLLILILVLYLQLVYLAFRCFSGFSTLCVFFIWSISSLRYQKLERHIVHVKSSSLSSSLNKGLPVTVLRAAAAAAAAAAARILASCSATAAIFFLLCGGMRVLPVRRPRVVTILPSSLRTTPPGPMRTMRVVPDLRKDAGSFLARAALAFAYA